MPASKYRAEIAENLPDLFDQGESVAEVCKELGIAKQTFFTWVKKHPKFAAAYEEGKYRSEAWWMRLGRLGAAGVQEINATAWIFNMKNRFEWRDARKTEHTGTVAHQHGAVSDTSAFLAGVLGAGQTDSPAEPGEERPILPH